MAVEGDFGPASRPFVIGQAFPRLSYDAAQVSAGFADHPRRWLSLGGCFLAIAAVAAIFLAAIAWYTPHIAPATAGAAIGPCPWCALFGQQFRPLGVLWQPRTTGRTIESRSVRYAETTAARIAMSHHRSPVSAARNCSPGLGFPSKRHCSFVPKPNSSSMAWAT